MPNEIPTPTIAIAQQTANHRLWQTPEHFYSTQVTPEGKLNALLYYTALSPSPHNTQPWGFRIDADTNRIFIHPDTSLHLSESDPTGREMWLGLGAAAGTLTVAAHRFGWNVTTELITDETTSQQYIQTSLTPGYTPTEADIKLFHAITNRVNYDGDHRTTPLTDTAISTIKAIFNTEDIEFKLVVDHSTKTTIADLVAQGDQLIYHNQSFIAELVNWVRDVATHRGDGILTSSLGLPPAVRRYAARLLLTAKKSQLNDMIRADSQKITASTTIGAIASKADNPQAWLEVGKLYQLASLAAATQGVYFGAKAVLIENDNLRPQLEAAMDLQGQAQMMFRAGLPAQDRLVHSPRRHPDTRRAIFQEGEWQVLHHDRPTILKLNDHYSLTDLLSQLGPNVQVDSAAFAVHWLPGLFNAQNPSLDRSSPTYFNALQEFVSRHQHDTEGVWVYYPHQNTLKHIPSETDFYTIITSSNRGNISEAAQLKLQNLHFGVAGVSGAGREAAKSLVMIGAKYLRLADFDFLSSRNQNRSFGQVGENKAWDLAQQLWEHNPFLVLDIDEAGITLENRHRFVKDLDLVIEETDGTSKFFLREAAQAVQCPVIMATDMKHPLIDLDRPGHMTVLKRAAKAGITAARLEAITTIAEATGIIAQLIGYSHLPAEVIQNFLDILAGQANSFSQPYPGVQAGGAGIGQAAIALAEGTFHQLPNSWVIRTIPEPKSAQIAKARLLAEFQDQYNHRFPPKT